MVAPATLLNGGRVNIKTNINKKAKRNTSCNNKTKIVSTFVADDHYRKGNAAAQLQQ